MALMKGLAERLGLPLAVPRDSDTPRKVFDCLARATHTRERMKLVPIRLSALGMTIGFFGKLNG